MTAETRTVAVLRVMNDQCDTSAKIAKTLGITVDQAGTTLWNLERTGYIVRIGTERIKGVKSAIRFKRTFKDAGPKVPSIAPILVEHETLTAAFCGDPAFQRSALYQRQKGEQ